MREVMYSFIINYAVLQEVCTNCILVLTSLPVFTFLVSPWSHHTSTHWAMYSWLINLLECQSIPMFCINLVQFTWSYAFYQSMKQAHNSSVMSKVHSNIFSVDRNTIATKYIWRIEHSQGEIWGLLLHPLCSVSITASIIIMWCIFPPCHLPSHKPWTRLFFTVIPCILILSKFFIYQLMHTRKLL